MERPSRPPCMRGCALILPRRFVADNCSGARSRAHLPPAPPAAAPNPQPQVSDAMSRVAGILDVHDLHVWNISTGIPVLTAHVHIGEDADPTSVLQALEVYVRRIGIRHSTIQICNPVAGDSASGSGSGGEHEHDHGHGHDHGHDYAHGDEEEGHGHVHGAQCAGHSHGHEH
jgi:hypothetical protein